MAITVTRRTPSAFVTWFAVTLSLSLAAILQVLIYGAPHLLHFGRYKGWLVGLAMPAFFLLPFIVFAVAIKPIRTLYPTKRSPVVLLAGLAVVATYLGVCVAFNLFGT